MVQLHGGSFHVCAGNIRRNDAVAVQVPSPVTASSMD